MIMRKDFFLVLVLFTIVLISCTNKNSNQEKNQRKISVIFDTDANNELDDQHALAYLLFSGNTFNLKAITVNATYNGGDINEHVVEAQRVVDLCGITDKVEVIKGANNDFKTIKSQIDSTNFDGHKAVNIIIEEAEKVKNEKLIILAVGKLTNVALALKKEPSIESKIRLVWLGSNFPESGEYNLENDIEAMNYLLKSNMDLEMVTVRYGKTSGTDAVRLTKEEAPVLMKGLGVQLKVPVEGRHGASFYNFGDYSVNLFENCHYYGNPPSRALFDMAAVAIVKNPKWGMSKEIGSPIMVDEKWILQPKNNRKIKIWENFNEEKIINDFVFSIKNFEQVNN
jgi:hypothetical protein